MKKTSTMAVLLATASLFGSVACAQDSQVELPPAFSDIPGVKFEGVLSGNETWSLPEDDFYISRDKETGNFFVGYLYGPDGADLYADKRGNEVRVSDIVSVGEDEVSAPESQIATPPREETPMPGLIEDDNRLLENAPEEIRNELLADLVERLGKVKTTQEYEKALLQWRSEVRVKLKAMPPPETAKNIVDELLADLSREQKSDQSPVVVPEPAAESAGPVAPATESAAPSAPATESAAPSAPAAESAVTAAEPENAFEKEQFELSAAPLARDAEKSAAENGGPTLDEIYSTVAENSNWFSVGKKGAPVVYAVIDPTCPYCSEALVGLRPAIEEGALQLRVVPAALLSQNSMNVLAGVMLSANPADALFLNAAYNRKLPNGVAVEKRAADELPADLAADLAVNQKNVIALGLTTIPFFVWKTQEGIQTFNEVAGPEKFAGALPGDEQ